MFNWFSLLSLIPYVIMGIQHLRKDIPGSTKKQLAMEALGLATQGAEAVLPTAQAAGQADVVSQAVGKIIDATVEGFHATNEPGFGINSGPPAPTASLPTTGSTGIGNMGVQSVAKGGKP